jgi:hypothetical protein
MKIHHIEPNLKDFLCLLQKLRRFVALVACTVLCSGAEVQQRYVGHSILVPSGLSRV